MAGSSSLSIRFEVEDSLKPPLDIAARTLDFVQMIALWTLKERAEVVMVRSESFSELRRLAVPWTSPLLEAVVMVDRDDVVDEENFTRVERMRLSVADL